MHLTGPAPDLGARVDEAIAQALVVAFGVIVLQELANGPAQRCFAEEDQAVETLSLEASHKPLQMGVAIGGTRRQPNRLDAPLWGPLRKASQNLESRSMSTHDACR